MPDPGAMGEMPSEAPIGVLPAPTPAAPRRPENFREFRLARLLILLESVPEMATAKPLHLERLGYYDFFTDNPFLVLEDEPKLRTRLLLAGFSERSLSYNSAAQRFTNRRARLQHDLAMLVALALVRVVSTDHHITFALTGEGRRSAGELQTFYARGFRASAEIVIRKLNRLGDRKLPERAREWLRAEPFLIDLYDMGEDG